MSCRVTILCDNAVGPVGGTLGEHGFAALVEYPGGTLLFDTGSGATLLHNALRMNRDLRQVTAVALSHGHYDHTGGLRPFLELRGKLPVYAHPAVFAPRFRVKDTGQSIPIGLPYAREFLEGLGADFTVSAEARQISPEIFLSGSVRRQTAFEVGDSGLFADPSGQSVDLLADDQSLIIRGDKGLVLVLGCCHAGLVNTIRAAQQLIGVTAVQAVIGGTHLGFCSQGQLDATVSALQELQVGRLYGSHCTGFAAAARLHQEFPGRFHPAMVGTTIEI